MIFQRLEFEIILIIDVVVIDDFVNALFGEIVLGNPDTEMVFLQYVSSYVSSSHEIFFHIANIVFAVLVVP